VSKFAGLYQILKNRYFIVSAAFIIWMSFFDPKDWGVILERKAKLRELEKSEQTLTKQIVETKKELSLLKTSALTIERYAREKHLMKKDNEEIFVVKTQ
jgi:cell division protein DivIC